MSAGYSAARVGVMAVSSRKNTASDTKYRLWNGVSTTTNSEKRVLYGRTVIYSSETDITRENLIDVLDKATHVHEKNRGEIEYLYNYYRGKQPILNKDKKHRPEINNKIVENHAYEIVEFKKGHWFGEPVQYVRRGESAKENLIPLLNEFMFLADKAKKDKELIEWSLIGGTAYRLIVPDAYYPDVPFVIDTLDPRSTFVVYNNGTGKRPLMGVKYIKTADDNILYSVYTKDYYYEVIDGKIVNIKPHALGCIPIIEYPANSARMGAFEVVLPILDALNDTISFRLDGIEQFIQAFVKFVNCELDKDQFESLKELGAILVKSNNGAQADVDIISQELDQSQTQITKDDLYQTMLIICGMPDRHQNSKSTSDTGQAVLLRDGWGSAEARAKDFADIFKSSEKEFLRIVLRILRGINGLDIDLSEVDIKLTRNKTDNLLVKTQGLQNMLEAGVHPKIAFYTCNLFGDPEQVYLDSEPYLQKWLKAEANITPANNKPNPEGDAIEGS